MKAFKTLASAAVLALGIASASHAATIANFNPTSGNSDFKWIHSATGGTFITINSSSDTTAQGVNVNFSFLDPSHDVLQNLSATMTFDAASSSATSIETAAPANLFRQTSIDGSFSFIFNGATGVYNGFNLTNGENLLSGTFTDAWIQGAGGSGSANLTIGNGGSATFTSSVLNLANASDMEFALTLLSVTPHFGNPSCPKDTDGPCSGSSLNTFRANGNGNFSAAGIPEPATWGLMIVGFGGMGLVLRNRRRPALATA